MIRGLLILLIIPLAVVGCSSSPAFIAAGEKYHAHCSKLIKDYIIDEKPIPNSLKTPEAKADLQLVHEKFKGAIEAEKQ